MKKIDYHSKHLCIAALILSLAGPAVFGACDKSAAERRTTPEPETPEPGTADETAQEKDPAADAPEALSFPEDKEFKTDTGLSFVVPSAWFMTRRENYMEFRDPSKEMWMGLVEIESEKVEDAIKEAWSLVRKDFDLEEDKTVKPPVGGSGWDEVAQTNYVTPARERRLVLAVAYRKGKKTYVAMIDGKIDVVSRRSAQTNTLLSSLKAPGMEKESFAGKTAHTLNKKRLAELEKFIEETLSKTGVAGAAAGIVQGGKVVYRKGFGVRRKGAGAPVTPATLFMIGSMTKSLTSMMMAKLVDEGAFEWSTAVKDIYPDFDLGDEEAASACTMLHTMCACTGMPRQDMEFLFEFRGATAESRMELLKTMNPTTDFGETFQYSNLLVAAGGYVAGHAAYPKLKLNAAYLRAMQNHLFKPAGMQNTLFNMAKVRRMNYAHPHARRINNEFIPIPLDYEETVVSVGPAGGAWSNVDDMLNYLRLELQRGKSVKGKQIISEENVTERWKPQARMSENSYYGLAVVVEKYSEVDVLSHGGGTLGFSTYMFWLPEHDLGMVILTNGQGSRVPGTVRRKLFEILFDGEPKAETNIEFALSQMKKNQEDLESRTDEKLDPEWIKPFLGKYTNESLGRMTLSLVKGRVFMDVGEWKSPVVKYTTKDGETRLMIGEPLAGLTFTPEEEDGKKTLTLHTAQQKYVFKKQ